MNNKKGFTLIELIVVIAVLGILVLLAAPKFLGYIEKAKIAQIVNDVKAYEDDLGVVEIDDEYFVIANFQEVNVEDLLNAGYEGNLYSKKGRVNLDVLAETETEWDGWTLLDEFEWDYYYLIDRNLMTVNSKLKGNFYVNSEGGVFYTEDPASPISNEIYYATDDDFEWIEVEEVEEWEDYQEGYYAVGKDGPGYFRYIDRGKNIVKIPNTIQGNPMTSYFKMFYYNEGCRVYCDISNLSVVKVISDNLNITDMTAMFKESTNRTRNLNLTELRMNNVKYTNAMFYDSKYTTIDTTDWNVSNVKSMDMMFRHTAETDKIIGIEDWDVSSVEIFDSMFYISNFPLDLSNWNTQSATSMSSMFRDTWGGLKGVSNWNVSNVKYMGFMFNGVYIDKSSDLNFTTWNTSNVEDMAGMLSNVRIMNGPEVIDVTGLDFDSLDDPYELFYYGWYDYNEIIGWHLSLEP